MKHAQTIIPQIEHARRSRCYVEAIILSHGIIQLGLRMLALFANQRARPTAISSDELARYLNTGQSTRQVHGLIADLEASHLIEPGQANLCRRVNDSRNDAAHNVVIGKIKLADLEAAATTGRNASSGVLQRLAAWFNNPVKPKWKRGEIPLSDFIDKSPSP
jgi:hypothetical protein